MIAPGRPSFPSVINLIFHPLSVRPTNRPCDRVRSGRFDVGIADDQARDFDFVAAEMKYDSTGMFHWTPSRPIEDCILVS